MALTAVPDLFHWYRMDLEQKSFSYFSTQFEASSIKEKLDIQPGSETPPKPELSPFKSDIKCAHNREYRSKIISESTSAHIYPKIEPIMKGLRSSPHRKSSNVWLQKYPKEILSPTIRSM